MIEYRFERYPSGLWMLRYWMYHNDGWVDAYHAFVIDVTEIPLIAGVMVQIEAQS